MVSFSNLKDEDKHITPTFGFKAKKIQPRITKKSPGGPVHRNGRPYVKLMNTNCATVFRNRTLL